MTKVASRLDAIESDIALDIFFNGISCYAIECNTPMGKNNRYHIDIYYIQKSDYFPIARIRWQHFGEYTEYSKLELAEYEFDKVDHAQFSPIQIPSNFTIISKNNPE